MAKRPIDRTTLLDIAELEVRLEVCPEALGPRQREELREGLQAIDRDAALRAEYELLRESVACLASLPAHDAPEGLFDAIWARAAAEAPQPAPSFLPVSPSPGRRTVRRLLAASLAAAAVVALAVVGVRTFWGPGSDGRFDRAPNGLVFVATDVGRVLGQTTPPGQTPAGVAVHDFLGRRVEAVRLTPAEAERVMALLSAPGAGGGTDG